MPRDQEDDPPGSTPERAVDDDGTRALRSAFAGPAASALTLPVESIVQRLLARDLDLATALDLALDFVLEATGAARGFLLVRDERGRLALSRGRGLRESDLPPEFSTSIVAETERTGEPVFLIDAVGDSHYRLYSSVKALGLRSVACVPIFGGPPAGAGSGLQGIVYLDDSHVAGRFGDRSRELLRALASAIAAPLANARLFEARQRVEGRARRRARSPAPAAPPAMVGRSEPMLRLLDLLARVAPTDVSVLIEGETGTGKELAARILHDLSGRSPGPFVAENIAAVASTLIEAELFGVARGAFTGADRDREGLFSRARGGTLFLDEVGELPLELQPKLLRVLQEKKARPVGGDREYAIDVRIVAATNKDVLALVRAGAFREDLLYRLRVVGVTMPPLRERLEDLPLLCEHILERIGHEHGEPVPPLSRAALVALAARPWPGNMRELESVLWQIVISGEGVLDRLPPVPSARTEDELGVSFSLPPQGSLPLLEEARFAFDRAYLSIVLGRSGGNAAQAARTLGISRQGLWKLLKRYGIDRA